MTDLQTTPRRWSGLDLPEPLDSAPIGAHVTYGRREVSWGPIYGPGEIERNRYAMAWFDVTEDRPWVGDRLRLTGQRRTDETYARHAFTEKARAALEARVLPQIARYGFDRLWMEVRTAHAANGIEGARRAAEEAEKDAAWLRALADLHEMHASGLTEIVRLPLDAWETVRIVPTYRGGPTSAKAAARVLLDGGLVGFLTSEGGLVPVLNRG